MFWQTSLVSTLVTVICCLCVASSTDPHLEELRKHYEHLAYIAGFKCHVPQPRVIPVHDLFSDTNGKAYFPDVTVLHRCDCAGSCTSGHLCGPVHTDNVHLLFKITFLQDVGLHNKGSWIMETHEFVNHTQCGCAVHKPPTVIEPQSLPGVGSSANIW